MRIEQTFAFWQEKHDVTFAWKSGQSKMWQYERILGADGQPIQSPLQEPSGRTCSANLSHSRWSLEDWGWR